MDQAARILLRVHRLRRDWCDHRALGIRIALKFFELMASHRLEDARLPLRTFHAQAQSPLVLPPLLVRPPEPGYLRATA